eukprot:11556042-Heterocapsa_arctica.AAC.1
MLKTWLRQPCGLPLIRARGHMSWVNNPSAHVLGQVAAIASCGFGCEQSATLRLITGVHGGNVRRRRDE